MGHVCGCGNTFTRISSFKRHLIRKNKFDGNFFPFRRKDEGSTISFRAKLTENHHPVTLLNWMCSYMIKIDRRMLENNDLRIHLKSKSLMWLEKQGVDYCYFTSGTIQDFNHFNIKNDLRGMISQIAFNISSTEGYERGYSNFESEYISMEIVIVK